MLRFGVHSLHHMTNQRLLHDVVIYARTFDVAICCQPIVIRVEVANVLAQPDHCFFDVAACEFLSAPLAQLAMMHRAGAL